MKDREIRNKNSKQLFEYDINQADNLQSDHTDWRKMILLSCLKEF